MVYNFKKNRTELEDKREIEKLKEYFDFNSYDLIITNKTHLNSGRLPKRDIKRILTRYNNIVEEYFLYSKKLGFFSKPKMETFEVILVGDLFTVHNRTTKKLKTYDVNNWKLLKERVQERVNVGMETERIQKEYIERHKMYYHY